MRNKLNGKEPERQVVKAVWAPSKMNGDPERMKAWKLSVSGYQVQGLNGEIGLLRMHWTRRDRYTKTIAQLVRSPGCPPPLKSPVDVVFCRAYRAREMDQDNLAASAKPVLDALRRAGVIEDDSPSHINLVICQMQRKKLGADWELVVRGEEAKP